MQLNIGGVRGTRPVTKDTFLEFGGDTTSFLVIGPAGERLIIDAGTGIMNFVPLLAGAKEITIFFTHYHLDHVLAFPWFPMRYQSEVQLKIYGPRLGWGAKAERALRRITSRPLWPAPAAAEIDFQVLPSGTVTVGKLQVKSIPVGHPGGCVAYRVEDKTTKQSFVVATDMEWQRMRPKQQKNLIEFSAGAKLLLGDAQFLPEEYEQHQGWGHSTWKDMIVLAQSAGIKKLLTIHHNPLANDELLLEREEQMQAAWGQAACASQGETLTV